MKFYNVTEKLFSDVKIVSVTLTKIAEDQYHTGLLYKSDNGNKILHLAGHNDFQNEIPTNEYIWIELPINETRSRQVSAMCRLIWKENEKSQIPYAFNSPVNVFDPETGSFLINNINVGLTCSSFVLATLNVTGIDIVIYNTWPKGQPEAIDWQNKIIRYLERKGTDPEHIKKIKEQIGNERFVPTQVCASVSNPPMDYNTANSLSSLVIKNIEELLINLNFNN